MTKDELNNEYLEWMCQLVYNKKYSGRLSYRKLLDYLYNAEFVYSIGTDGNRADDGIDLRYRFGYERVYTDVIIAEYLDDRSCSILEMLVALAVRCEEHIMGDPDIGNRTGQWFWNMIINLGLNAMSDQNFNRRYTDGVISKFLNREYGRDGKGGLFTVDNCQRDLRNVEIWYQMCWYLDGVI
jgi:hypothetical protein